MPGEERGAAARSPRAPARSRPAAASRRRAPARTSGCRSCRRRRARAGSRSRCRPRPRRRGRRRGARCLRAPRARSRRGRCRASARRARRARRSPTRACRARAARARTRRRRCRRTTRRASCDSSELAIRSEVVAQPLHVGARREHDRFDAPRDAAAVAPRDDRERAVLAALRERRRRVVEHDVEHAAGAERDLGVAAAARSPGRRATPAGRRRARRSAARPAARVASPTTPAESTIVGIIAAGTPSVVEHRCVPPRRVAVLQPGDRGVRRVGHVQRAVRQRPRDPRVDGAEAELAARGRGRRAGRAATAPWWPTGSGRRARPRRAASRHAPIVRRSCQPSPGPIGLAGRAVPHDGRAALVGDADRVDRAVGVERGARELEARVAPAASASNSHEPVGGGVGQQLALVAVRERCRRRRTTAARTLLVPTSTTSTRPFALMISRPGDCAEGAREPELARVEDAVRVERVLHRLQHAEARRRARRRRSGRGSGRRRGDG